MWGGGYFKINFNFHPTFWLWRCKTQRFRPTLIYIALCEHASSRIPADLTPARTEYFRSEIDWVCEFTNHKKKHKTVAWRPWSSYYFIIGHDAASIGTSEAFFKTKLLFFFGYLILSIYLLTIKINIFRGDLSSISAKTATLIGTCWEEAEDGACFDDRIGALAYRTAQQESGLNAS